MPTTTPRFAPRVDALESRLALSTATASAAGTLTLAEYGAARTQIADAVAIQASRGSVAREDAALGRAVRNVPDGAALLATLEAETTAADPGTRAAAAAERQQLWHSLDVAIGLDAATSPTVAAPTSRVASPPTPQPPAPPPAASFPPSFSVTIVNRTNRPITVNFTQASSPIPLTSTFITGATPAYFVPIILNNQRLPITLSVSGFSGTANTTNAFTELVVSLRNGQPYYQTY